MAAITRRRIAACFYCVAFLSIILIGWVMTSIAVMQQQNDGLFDAPPITAESSTTTSFAANHNQTTTINCGCPSTCTGMALAQRMNGLSYSCRERIQYLMRTYGSSQYTACVSASSNNKACDATLCHPEKCLFNTSVKQKLQEKISLPNNVQSILIIATVPKDEKHAVALWTELECLTTTVDLVIVSAPEPSRTFMEAIADRARNILNLQVVTRYYPNDRYDVGLWCDALQDIDDFSILKSILLVNDSVFVLRNFTGISDKLSNNSNTLDMVGLSYSKKTRWGDRIWLESVYRGFTAASISKYIKHACLEGRIEHCMMNKRVVAKRKRCIVEASEIAIAGLYEKSKVVGLYPSEPSVGEKMWVGNDAYWKTLVKQHDFPVSKVNRPGAIGDVTDERLHKCTQKMDFDFLHNFNYTEMRL